MKDLLFTTRILFYRARPDQDAIDDLDEIKELEAIVEPTDEQSARLAELQQTTQALVDEYKYTVGVISVLQGNQRSANLRKARAWIEEQCGISVSDHLNIPEADRQDDWFPTLEFMNAATSWATVSVALRGIKHRQTDLLSDFKTEWEEIDIPPEWATISGFLDSIDRELLSGLISKISEINPGMLLIGRDDENSKKYGVVSGR